MSQKRWRRRTVAILQIAAIRILQMLPVRLGRLLARCVGIAIFHLARRRRANMERTLDAAYGGTLTRQQTRRIARAVFVNLATVGVEFPHMRDFKRGKAQGYVEVRGLENIDLSQGGLFPCAHLGNWEWMAPAFAALGYPVAEVVNTYKDELYERSLNDVRRSGGITPVPKDGAIEVYTDLLARKNFVGVIIDQVPRENGVPAMMFGRRCWATVGPAVLAMRTQAPVHFAGMRRQQDGTYVMEISPRILMERSDDPQHDILVFTQKLQDYVERAVRECPEQWLWVVDRWRDRPELQKQWEARQADRTT